MGPSGLNPRSSASAETQGVLHENALANVPGRSEEAFQLATELAVEAKMDERRGSTFNTVQTLLGATERQKPDARD
jgi:hypothetical protein